MPRLRSRVLEYDGLIAPSTLRAALARRGELLVELQQLHLGENLPRGQVLDDVVPGLDHVHLVSRDRRRPRQELDHARVEAHEAVGQVQRRPVRADGLADAGEELVPGDHVRAAEIEGPTCRRGPVDGEGEEAGHVLDPDRLHARGAGPDDDVHRRLRQPPEGFQRPAARPEDEARPEDHVVHAGGRDCFLHLLLAAKVGDRPGRVLVQAEGAHEHEAPDSGSAGCRDDVACALAHDPLEVLRLALDDRDEVDDGVGAGNCGAKRLRLRHVALDELDPEGAEVVFARRLTDERADRQPAVTQRRDHARADEACATGDEDGPG